MIPENDIPTLEMCMLKYKGKVLSGQISINDNFKISLPLCLLSWQVFGPALFSLWCGAAVEPEKEALLGDISLYQED